MEYWSWPPSYDDRFVPPREREHWFPTRETMDPAARETAILERIQQVMATRRKIVDHRSQ